MGTPLELIEVERERVQELRTRFVIAKAFQDELDERTRGHVLEFANTTIRQMVSDHRYGLVARVAGWVRAATGHHGFIDQLAVGDYLSAFRAMSKDDEEYRPAIGGDATDPFARLFPGVPSGAAPAPADLEPIRAQLLDGAANVLENAELVRRHLDGGGASTLEPVALEEVHKVIKTAEDLLNDFAICAGGAEYEYSEYLAHPVPSVAARDLVDLELIGTIDRLMSATKVNERLGASGMWWWQYREEFWQQLSEAAEAYPSQPMNSAKAVESASSHARSLTTPQIERLVARYRLEYARYDATARSVEDKLRKILDAERVKALLSSRAKDPKSLGKKLETKQSKYEFAKLDADLGSVVTDLAGVRVIVYDDEEAEQVAKLIKDTWKGCQDEPINRRYKARHFTVVVADGESQAIDGARCEIQVTSLAAHAFNELEHDIGYKHQGVPPGEEVQGKLKILENNTAMLQAAIRDLLTARKIELSAAKVEIATGSDLGVVLDDVIRARVTGDVDALFYVWQGVERQLTRTLVAQQAPLLLGHGRALSGPNVDDATAIATALSVTLQSEVRDIAREYPNQDSALIRAILGASPPENA